MTAIAATISIELDVTDEQLVGRVLAGDVQAYGRLVARYERTVLAAVLSTVRDVHAAQDVVQDVFVNAYLNLASLRSPAKFGAWLLKAAGRQAVHAGRRQMRMRLVPLDDSPAAETSKAIADDERERLLKAVRCLPVHERVAVSLRYFDGHGVHEIAQLTGRPVGTVTKQLTRAIERLRADLT
jgi:RNA polymerase sigma-70 factor (ECF subfamily)